jgi:hypothetical protein
LLIISFFFQETGYAVIIKYKIYLFYLLGGIEFLFLFSSLTAETQSSIEEERGGSAVSGEISGSVV